MIDQKTINKALIGNAKAADVCTKAGLLIPCAFCGGHGVFVPSDGACITYAKQPNTRVYKKIKTTYSCDAECSSCRTSIYGNGESIEDAKTAAAHRWNRRMDVTPIIGQMVSGMLLTE